MDRNANDLARRIWFNDKSKTHGSTFKAVFDKVFKMSIDERAELRRQFRAVPECIICAYSYQCPDDDDQQFCMCVQDPDTPHYEDEEDDEFWDQIAKKKK